MFYNETIWAEKKEVQVWVKSRALEIGFVMVISSSNHRLESSGREYVHMRCNGGERYRDEGKDLSVAERVATKTKACGCRARIKIMFLDYLD